MRSHSGRVLYPLVIPIFFEEFSIFNTSLKAFRRKFGKEMIMRADGIAERLVAAWRTPYVARSQVREFSGGLFSPKTLANADSAKQGPLGAIRVGKRKVRNGCACLHLAFLRRPAHTRPWFCGASLFWAVTRMLTRFKVVQPPFEKVPHGLVVAQNLVPTPIEEAVYRLALMGLCPGLLSIAPCRPAVALPASILPRLWFPAAGLVLRRGSLGVGKNKLVYLLMMCKFNL